MDKPINNDTPIMGNCLSCKGLVRVPATAPTSSTVKCPHCNEAFQLSQILNHAVPELEIVVDEQETDEVEDEGALKDSEGRFVVAKQLRQGSKKKSRRRRRRRSSESDGVVPEGMVPVPKPLINEDSNEDSESSTAVIDEVDGSRFSVSDSKSKSPRESFDSRRSSSRSSSSDSSRSRSRSRSSSTTRKSSGSNAAVEIIKVVLGGAMAIPIAYLLVLWVFRQDPLDVAPKISKTVPMLVPAQFHPDEEEFSAVDEDAEEDKEDDGWGGILDASGDGLPKPNRDPSKVGVN